MSSNEEPIERSVFNEVHRLVMLEVMADRESVEEPREEDVSARFTDEENEAWAYLIEQHKDVVAEAYLYLMHRYVELELISSEPPREVHTEAPEAFSTATEQAGRVEPQAPLEGAQTPTEATDEQQGRGPIPEPSSSQEPTEPRSREPWWVRWFGG